MSMITEQIKRLKDEADHAKCTHDYTAKLLREAADTIEQLAAKVRKENGFIFPENPTNGDVIKALFPRIKIKKYPTFLRVIEGEEYIPMTYDWWNSPYKRGDTEC